MNRHVLHPGRAVDISELFYADMEAARKVAEAAYFDVRPSLSIDTDDSGEPELYRALFRAGFERAFRSLWKPPTTGSKQC